MTGEELTLSTTLFNSEQTDATVKSITYTSGTEVLGTQTGLDTLKASSTLKVDWKYTPETARETTIRVTALLEQGGTSTPIPWTSLWTSRSTTTIVIPNTIVEDGQCDTNYFQHQPYLDNFNKEKGTHLVTVAGIHVEPMGIYGGKQDSLAPIVG